MKLTDTNYTAEEIQKLTEKYMINTTDRFHFVAERANDMYLYDTDGKKYLDFYGGLAVNNVGNVNERVVRAVQDQAELLMQTFNYPYTVAQALLAQLICETLGYEKIFFQNSGSEANEAMIKLARKYGVENFHDQRYRIVTAKNSFHGRTYGALSATGQPESPNQKGYFPVLDGFSYAPLNDLKAFQEATDENTIAIMIEPLQGEGGVCVCDREFVRGLRKWCDENEILLLFDEVQTGWGRTGKLMGYMHYDVKPDMLSIAKGMGGGMPIGALVTSEKLGKTFGKGAHGTTFGGNPVSCAAAYAAIRELLDKKLWEQAEEVGAYFRQRARELPHVVEVRGLGQLNGIKFSIEIAEKRDEIVEKGLLTTFIGKHLLRVVPPLTATKEHVDEAIAILQAVLSKEETR